MKSSAFNRRSFLAAAATAGVSSIPLLRLFERTARADPSTQPLNFICMYHPHGLSAEYWAMRDGETETQFDLGYTNCSLQPFDDAATYGKSFKDKIIILEGLDLLSAANGHDTAGTILTGSTISNKTPQNTSLDQFLAVEHMLGASTPVTSIALGVGTDSTDPGVTLSYGPGGVPLPKIIDPMQTFKTLFGNLVVSSDPAEQAAADHRRKVGKSILDFVRGDINDLRPKLGSAEQQKLDQHLTSLLEIEKQLSGGGLMSCMVPSAPDATKFPSLKQYNGGEPYFDAITNAHIDLLAQAIACGVTRFGTLLMNDLSYAGNPLGLPADNHGGVAHTYNGSKLGSNGHGGPGDPATWVPLAKFNQYSYSKVARLMQKLDQFGALDNTLIYVSSDMGNPALHSTQNVPTLLAGGAGGKLKMGRRVRLPSDCPSTNEWCQPSDATYAGLSNNHLLISIAQAFGVDIDTYGTQPLARDTKGTLTQLG